MSNFKKYIIEFIEENIGEYNEIHVSKYLSDKIEQFDNDEIIEPTSERFQELNDLEEASDKEFDRLRKLYGDSRVFSLTKEEVERMKNIMTVNKFNTKNHYC